MRCHHGEEDRLSDAEHVVGRKNEAAVESGDRKLVEGMEVAGRGGRRGQMGIGEGEEEGGRERASATMLEEPEVCWIVIGNSERKANCRC